jgi:hypothetical protein
VRYGIRTENSRFSFIKGRVGRDEKVASTDFAFLNTVWRVIESGLVSRPLRTSAAKRTISSAFVSG